MALCHTCQNLRLQKDGRPSYIHRHISGLLRTWKDCESCCLIKSGLELYTEVDKLKSDSQFEIIITPDCFRVSADDSHGMNSIFENKFEFYTAGREQYLS